MLRRSRLAVVAGLAAVLSLSAFPAQAVDVPSDLQYSYTMNQPLIGNIRDSATTNCYQSLGDPFTLSMQAGPASGLMEAIQKRGNEIVCTIVIERLLSDVAITGTAEASAQGQSGKGSFALTCEVGQKRSSFFTMKVSSMGLPEFGDNPYGMEGNGYVSCTWNISVDDEQKSQLAGTLEVNGAYTKDSERVSCEEAGITVSGGSPDQTYCVAFDLTVNAFLTGATGAYAGRTGEGTLTQRGYAAVTIPLKLENDPTCPPEAPNCGDLMNQSFEGCDYSATDPGTGGWTQVPSIPPFAAPPGYRGPGWYKCGGGADGGGGGETPEESPFDPSIPPCVTGEDGSSGPPEGFSTCVTPGPSTSSSVMTRALEAGVMAATGQQLSLSTTKKAGSTRFVSPAQTTANPVRDFGAKGASNPSIRIATVPGAICAVTAASGSAKATVTKRGVAVGGQLDTKVKAATLMSQLKAAKGATATITAACSTKAGKKTVKLPSTSIQVVFT